MEFLGKYERTRSESCQTEAGNTRWGTGYSETVALVYSTLNDQHLGELNMMRS